MQVQKFLRLKEKLEQLQTKADRSQGALDQLMERLQTEFGCPTVKKAKELLHRLEVEQQELEGQFTENLAQFEQEFGELLQ